MIHRGRVATVALVLAGCTTTHIESITTLTERDGDRAAESPATESGSPSTSRPVAHPAGFASYVKDGTGDGSGGSPPPSSSTTVTTDKGAYAYGEPIRVTFAGFAGNAFDWISFAPEGSSEETISWWSYTHGAHGGTIQTHPADVLPTGTFVARGYFDDSYAIEAVSTPFTIGAMPALPVSVSTDKASYGGLETVLVTFSGFGGDPLDWIGPYPPHASMLSYSTWRFTDGMTSGTLALPPLYGGTQEIRAFEANKYELKGRSATFTVAAEVKTDRAAYGAGMPVVVSFGGMAGPWSENWVAISVFGSEPEAYETWMATGTKAGGTRSFDVSGLPDGTYVARAFFGADPIARAESAPFTIAR